MRSEWLANITFSQDWSFFMSTVEYSGTWVRGETWGAWFDSGVVLMDLSQNSR